MRLKKLLSKLFLAGFIGTLMPATVYGADVGVQLTDSGHGDIRYYTEGFTLHRVYKDYEAKTELTNDEVKQAYGPYIQNYNADRKESTGSIPLGATVNDSVYGEADPQKFIIAPFKEGENKGGGAIGNGMVSTTILIKGALDPNYAGKATAMQNDVNGIYSDYFMNQEITYDAEGNPTNPPVVIEANGIISLLSKNGAGRDQYSLLGPDGWWYLGGINTSNGVFYGHQYTLEDGMIPADEPDPDKGGVYRNVNGALGGITSERYNKGGTGLMTLLPGNLPSYNKRMHLRFFKCYLPNQLPVPEEENLLDFGIWEETGEYGRSFPEVYTYNTSDEFNTG